MNRAFDAVGLSEDAFDLIRGLTLAKNLCSYVVCHSTAVAGRVICFSVEYLPFLFIEARGFEYSSGK